MPRYAAIDIGSNSVRMLAAEVTPGAPHVTLASDREVTRLGESVFRAGRISNEAIQLLSTVLARMAAAYNKFDIAAVRAVATAAVRDASNQQEFLKRASDAINAPIEIISGQEEARLVHLGVQTLWPHEERIMIVDIGGGSAEIILSEGGKAREAFSKPLGAVRLTGVFLKDDPPSDVQFEQMMEFIDEKLHPVVSKIGVKPCKRFIATSSTAGALVCAVNRIPRDRRDQGDRLRADVSQTKKLLDKLLERDLAKRAKITGIGPRRAQIIIPGVALLLRIMQQFRLPALHYSTGGVRDGIVADLAARRVGSEQAHLSREQRSAVEAMTRKFATNPSENLHHARQVAGFGRVLFESLEQIHRLPQWWGKLIEAAAYLYDTGHFVNDTGHHKHSAYLVQNSGLPAFTGREKTLIAMLCRFHRKSMPEPRHIEFQALPDEDKAAILLLIPLLRLADAFDRSKEQKISSLECRVNPHSVQLLFAGKGRTDLEQWAAGQSAEIFRSVYGRTLQIERIKR